MVLYARRSDAGCRVPEEPQGLQGDEVGMRARKAKRTEPLILSTPNLMEEEWKLVRENVLRLEDEEGDDERLDD